MRRFRFLDHTGDILFEVYGRTLRDLYENAGLALFSAMTDPSKVRAEVLRRIALGYEDIETLMVDWLGELLYIHEVEGLLFGRFEVEGMDEGRFDARAWGEPYDAGRHAMRTGVKAVTFHQLEVREERGGWRARVVLDV